MNMPVPAYPVSPYTPDQLTKALNRAVLRLFMPQPGSNQASPIVFLTSVYASLQKKWDDTIPTACTNGSFLKINPDFFMWCSEDFRPTLLAHETWHVGFLHCDPERRGKRHPKLWNEAIDYATNWMLHEQGFKFDTFWPGNPWGEPETKIFGLLDARFAGMSAEQIYEILYAEAPKDPKTGEPGDSSANPLDGDVEEVLTIAEKHELVGKIVQAIQQSKMASEPERIPGDIQEVIEQLINPKLPWPTLLRKYCTERSSFSTSWKRPNRRYKAHGIHLPTRGGQDSLDFILFASDDSGSMRQDDFSLMNSELKAIWDELKPRKLTMVTCDSKIQDVWEFNAGDSIDRLTFTGRGSTNLEPVFEYAHSLAEKPKLIIMCSDLECEEPENPGIDVLWVRFGDRGFVPSYGTTIQVDR